MRYSGKLSDSLVVAVANPAAKRLQADFPSQIVTLTTMSQQAQATASETTPSQQRDDSKMRKYLNNALDVLKDFGISGKDSAPQELISLLESVKHLDEAKVLAIADVIQHMGSFNALVRENIESVQVGNRYLQITQEFDSIREDSKRLIAQLDDGRISGTEKLSNWWMKIRRGTPSDRFENIVEIYYRCRQGHQRSAQERRPDHGGIHRFPICTQGSRGARARIV